MTSHNYVAENIYRIKKQLNNDDILIVAVSKTVTSETAALALEVRVWSWEKTECRSS